MIGLSGCLTALTAWSATGDQAGSRGRVGQVRSQPLEHRSHLWSRASAAAALAPAAANPATMARTSPTGPSARTSQCRTLEARCRSIVRLRQRLLPSRCASDANAAHSVARWRIVASPSFPSSRRWPRSDSLHGRLGDRPDAGVLEFGLFEQ